jgi:hypothetical protein
MSDWPSRPGSCFGQPARGSSGGGCEASRSLMALPHSPLGPWASPPLFPLPPAGPHARSLAAVPHGDVLMMPCSNAAARVSAGTGPLPSEAAAAWERQRECCRAAERRHQSALAARLATLAAAHKSELQALQSKHWWALQRTVRPRALSTVVCWLSRHAGSAVRMSTCCPRVLPVPGSPAHVVRRAGQSHTRSVRRWRARSSGCGRWGRLLQAAAAARAMWVGGSGAAPPARVLSSLHSGPPRAPPSPGCWTPAD